MRLTGKVHKFGDDINTDYIISGKYKFKTLDMQELARHVMEDIDPGFVGRVRPGDLIAAGRNFGCGSSREQAPRALLACGIRGVLAKSFARIFFRNAINCGLLVVECDTDQIENGDEVAVDLEEGEVINLTRNVTLSIPPLPEVVIGILREGGLVNYFRKHGSLEKV